MGTDEMRYNLTRYGYNYRNIIHINLDNQTLRVIILLDLV